MKRPTFSLLAASDLAIITFDELQKLPPELYTKHGAPQIKRGVAKYHGIRFCHATVIAVSANGVEMEYKVSVSDSGTRNIEPIRRSDQQQEWDDYLMWLPLPKSLRLAVEQKFPTMQNHVRGRIIVNFLMGAPERFWHVLSEPAMRAVLEQNIPALGPHMTDAEHRAALRAWGDSLRDEAIDAPADCCPTCGRKGTAPSYHIVLNVPHSSRIDRSDPQRPFRHRTWKVYNLCECGDDYWFWDGD